jgi:O-antigen ligase
VFAILGLGAAIAAGFISVATPSRDLALTLGAAFAGVVLLLLAYTRFQSFVLALLVVRATLDWTKAPSDIDGPTTSGPMAMALALLFLGATALWLLVQFRTGRLRRPSLLSIAWVVFLGVAFFSALAADRRMESLAEWGRIATVVAMLLVLEQMLGAGLNARQVLAACFLSAVLPLGVAAYQAIGDGSAGVLHGVARVQGTFAHPNAFGFYLAILITMGAALLPHVAPTTRPMLLAFLWISAAATILTSSRGSWFVLVVGLIVVGALQSPRVVVLVLGAAAVIALTVPNVLTRLSDLQTEPRAAGIEGNSLAWRLDYWGSLIDLTNDSPIIGIGPKMTEYVSESGKVPHNDFLRAYVETGTLGLVAYIGVVAALFQTARLALRRAPDGLGQGVAVGFAGCVSAFLVFSVGENLMSQVVVLWYFVAFAAAAITFARGYPHMGETHPDRDHEDRQNALVPWLGEGRP